MTTEDGQLRNVEEFHSMLENGGDVYEAAQECFGMIWWMASEIDKLLVDIGSASRQDREGLQIIIATAEANYKDGLNLGGVEPE